MPDAAIADLDGDGVPDDADNCAEVPNPRQTDADEDGLGDACDVGDTDGDGIPDRDDGCPLVEDASNADQDRDGIGDVCDLCPRDADPMQADADGDGIGDACEILNDDDADGVPDGTDVCPQVPDPDQRNRDEDAFGDARDVCPNVTDPDQLDTDGDGAGDACDPCPESVEDREAQADMDGDGVPVCAGDCDDADPLRAGGLVERCDGVDNDCDNVIDEGYALGEACVRGLGRCARGGEQICLTFYAAGCSGSSQSSGRDDICDGIDNDCDGATDEAGGRCCRPDARRPCGTDAGTCEAGEQVCNGSGAWQACDGVGPVEEICDGLDNDRDGGIDEMVSITCGVGICEREHPACLDGEVPACNAFLGAQDEVCNRFDDDCDGETDEGWDFATDPNNCGDCGRVCPEGVACEDGRCDGLLLFGGIRQDVADARLEVWRSCYESDSSNANPATVNEIRAACDGTHLMVGCRPMGSATWTVLAQGEADSVFRDVGPIDPFNTHEHNGSQWYFTPDPSLGFAPLGALVFRDPCDSSAEQGERRLCWFFGSGRIVAGGRCGVERTGREQNYERRIWTVTPP